MPILSLSIFAGYEKQIVIPQVVLQDSWVVHPLYLEHTLNVRSTVHKRIPSLKLNTVYRITYEVYNYVNCSVYLKVGTKEGQVQTGNAIVTEEFLIENDSDRTLTFVSDGLLRIRGIAYEEKVFNTVTRPFSDKTRFQNKSWTLSYSFYSNSWVSYHSYLPLYYIHNQSHLYSFEGNRDIWKHNIDGLFQNYYGEKYPYIVEFVNVDDSLQTRITEGLSLITKARKWNPTEQEYQDERFITFNKLTAYNDRSSTGELDVVVKDTMPNPADWLFHQIKNTPGQILITRKERDWNLNEIRNYVIDPALPLFSTSWAKLQDAYFIDKIVNQGNIDHTMEWSDTEMLRDKFIIIRLKFDTFDNVNLIFNFSLGTEQISNR